jgi:SnoaL-like domain
MKRVLLTGLRAVLAVAATVIIAATGVADESGTSKTQHRRDLAFGEAWAAGWNSHDPDRVVEDYAEDVRYEDLALGVVLNGREALRAFAANVFLAVPDAHFAILPDETFVRGTVAHVGWIFTGTDVGIFGTGRPFRVRGSSPLGLADSGLSGHGRDRRLRIERAADYYDLATIMTQVGVLPCP